MGKTVIFLPMDLYLQVYRRVHELQGKLTLVKSKYELPLEFHNEVMVWREWGGKNQL